MESEWGMAAVTGVSAAVTILVGVPVLYGALRQVWARSIGRRRGQTRLLNQIACGSTVEYIDQLLGTPQFRSTTAWGQDATAGDESRLYRLSGAWVAVQVRDGAVLAFSITVTDRSMGYAVDRHTWGLLRATLGRGSFATVGRADPRGPDGTYCWIGANRVGYLEHYTFGNQAGYQQFWLSYNLCGAGQMAMPQPFTFMSGTYAEVDTYAPADGDMPDLRVITPNTLTVLGPASREGDSDRLLRRNVLGADQATVRLDVSRR